MQCNLVLHFFFLITKVSSTSKEVNIIPVSAVPEKYIVLSIKSVSVLLQNIPPVPTGIDVMVDTIKK